MRHSVGHVARPPFLSFIAPLRFRSFSPACSRANDLGARPLGHLRHEYHSTVPSSFQTLLPVNIFGKDKKGNTRKPRSTSSRLSIRKSSSTNGPDNSLNAPRSELPSHEEGRRSHISKSFTRVMDHLQSNIFIAGQRLNDLTGYSGIEALKKDIEIQETDVQKCRSDLQQAREAYSTAISQRSSSQREVNELLQRKHAWSPNDLERFTALYRSDHANEQSESSAQERLAMAERQAEEATAKLSASILARYHEEQIWSDKIRRMSTWGTWGLMGVNVLLFLIFQIGVEPWRRKRLVKGFEDKVMEALEREGPVVGARKLTTIPTSEAFRVALEPALQTSHQPPLESVFETAHLTTELSQHEKISSGPEAQSRNLPSAVSTTESTHLEPQLIPPKPPSIISDSALPSPPPNSSPLPSLAPAAAAATPTTLKDALRDLFSARPVIVRRMDLTTIALEGAAAGMALAGLVAVLVLRAR